MKRRNVILLAMVLALIIALSAAWIVLADRGAAPHSGGCVSYCARAIIYEDFDGDGEWVPWDADEDGKVEICLQEGMDDAKQCHKSAFCPEIFDDPDYPEGRCVLPKDGLGVWCRVMNGPDTHGRGHEHED